MAICAVITAVLLLGVDQLTKYYIVTHFTLFESTDFIKGLIRIVYIHNEGAAWGVLSGKTWILIVFTAAAMFFCGYYFWKYAKNNKLVTWAIALVISGGVGNLIDRVFRNGKVVDFLQFDFWQEFPVFNIADCAIVVGVALLILYFIIDTVKESKARKQGKQDENAKI